MILGTLEVQAALNLKQGAGTARGVAGPRRLRIRDDVRDGGPCPQVVMHPLSHLLSEIKAFCP